MPNGSARITHLALPVRDLEQSTAFYQRWASLEPTGEIREQLGRRMAALTDSGQSFSLVLIEAPEVVPLASVAHVGVNVNSNEEVTRVAEDAMREGCLGMGASLGPDPLGFSAFLRDPDGHQLEIYHGEHAGVAGV